MKVTLENWSSVQEKIRQLGIKDTEYDSKGTIRIIIAQNGERFEFAADTLKQFQEAGLTKLGIRIQSKKE